jgi:hypothetical protein
MTIGPANFTRYLDWAQYARGQLHITPEDQYRIWRDWWREFIGMPEPLAGVKTAGGHYTDCTGSIPDEVAS